VRLRGALPGGAVDGELPHVDPTDERDLTAAAEIGDAAVDHDFERSEVPKLHLSRDLDAQ
jgi:hypothetical protein